MIFIFANVWFFGDIFNLSEFHEKQNIEYQLTRRVKSEDSHDDSKVPKGGILNISKDQEEKLMFFI